jgi:outer membrane receptor for ferrienterochelin and colicin
LTRWSPHDVIPKPMRLRGDGIGMWLALSFFLAAEDPGILLAQTQPHEDVVVTAHLMPVPFKNSARTVRILTAADIARIPARSVTDLIRHLTGVEVRARGRSFWSSGRLLDSRFELQPGAGPD